MHMCTCDDPWLKQAVIWLFIHCLPIECVKERLHNDLTEVSFVLRDWMYLFFLHVENLACVCAISKCCKQNRMYLYRMFMYAGRREALLNHFLLLQTWAIRRSVMSDSGLSPYLQMNKHYDSISNHHVYHCRLSPFKYLRRHLLPSWCAETTDNSKSCPS